MESHLGTDTRAQRTLPVAWDKTATTEPERKRGTHLWSFLATISPAFHAQETTTSTDLITFAWRSLQNRRDRQGSLRTGQTVLKRKWVKDPLGVQRALALEDEWELVWEEEEQERKREEASSGGTGSIGWWIVGLQAEAAFTSRRFLKKRFHGSPLVHP